MKHLSWLVNFRDWLIAIVAGFNVRLTVSSLVELAGIAAIVWGCYLIAPFLAFIVGGLALLLIGRGIDPPIRTSGEGE